MLRLDVNAKKLVTLPKSQLSQLGLQEKGDVQQMILRSPKEFCQEIDDDLLL